MKNLRESIRENGLIHPPTAWLDPTTDMYVLAVGERRLTAIRALAAAGTAIRFQGEELPLGHIPILTNDDLLDEVRCFETELDENLHREALSWQDRARALSALHEMRKSQNPGQTQKQTAEEIKAITNSGNTLNAHQKDLRSANVVAQHLDNPKIASARTMHEAAALILKGEEERLRAIIARRNTATVAQDESPVQLRLGDMITILPDLPDEMCDLILADAPYGINAGQPGFRSRSVHHHNYEDTPEQARAILHCVLTEGFRVMKRRGNLFILTDIRHWEWLQGAAKNMGWTPFRTPIIWQKSQSEGLAPWGSAGFRRTYDLIFYATKGDKGLLSSPVDIIQAKRVPRHERVYAAEKPFELWKILIECSTLPGDFILDPCCGSGSSMVAALRLSRRGLGIEIDEEAYNTAVTQLEKEKSGVEEPVE